MKYELRDWCSRCRKAIYIPFEPVCGNLYPYVTECTCTEGAVTKSKFEEMVAEYRKANSNYNAGTLRKLWERFG